jgi:hypothetical protein
MTPRVAYEIAASRRIDGLIAASRRIDGLHTGDGQGELRRWSRRERHGSRIVS